MSAWRKQATPLVFLELAMAAVIKGNEHYPVMQRINARVDKWIHEAWKPLRSKEGRIDDQQAMRVTSKAANQIHEGLIKFWGNGNIQSQSELPSAMLVIAEDVLAGLPKNKPERRRAWSYLVKALFDLCLAADPDLTDNAGQERGIQIAGIVMEVA